MINESIITQGSPMIASDLLKSVPIIFFGLIAIFFLSRLRKFEHNEQNINKSILNHIRENKYDEIITEGNILEDAYNLFRNQCNVSFYFGLAFASISFFFLLLTTGFLVYRNSADLAGVSAIAGGLTSFASAIGFYLYHKSQSNLMGLVYTSYNKLKEEKLKNLIVSKKRENYGPSQATTPDLNIETTPKEKIKEEIEETNGPVSSYR